MDQIHGQERAIAILKRALSADRLPQAYLFTGPAHSGKHTTALALAMAANCETRGSFGCQQCSSCAKIQDGNHPDVRVISPQGAQKRIPIESIRKEVLPLLAMPPHEGRARFFLIEEAASMMAPAANALLKTLEEPPARNHFILGCVAPVQLLPTIRSRCQRISFQGLSQTERAKLGGDSELADELATQVNELMEVATARGLDNILRAATKAGDRLTLLRTLASLAESCHVAARNEAESGTLARATTYGAHALQIGETLMAVRDHNAHPQLALEDLLVALRGFPLPPAMESQ